MKHRIFSIFDQKAHAYLPPWIMHRVEMAERVFSDCCNSDDHQFGKHPEDYTLVQIGTFEDATGVIEPLEVQKTLGTGINYLLFGNSEQQGKGNANEKPVGDETPIQPSSER